MTETAEAAGGPPSRPMRVRRRIPFIPQTTETDCGAACLAMVLGAYGRSVSLEEVRGAAVRPRDGMDALSLLELARSFQLRGRGVKVHDLAHLRQAGRGAILHWRFSHFVVLEHCGRRGVRILDPALGRRRLSWEEIGRAFTGVALLFEPAAGFAPDSTRQAAAARRRGTERYLRMIFAEWPSLAKVIAASLLLQLLALSLPLTTGLVVDRIAPTGSRDLLTVLSLGLAAVVGFHFLASLVRSRMILQLNVLLDHRMTMGFLEHLVDLPFPFFQQRSAGDLMNRMTSNVRIREIVAGGGISGLLDAVLIAFYLVLLLLGNLRIGLLVLGLGTLRALLFLATRRRHQELMSEALEVEARSRNFQVQILAGIETLKASGAEHRAVERWSGLYVSELNVVLARGRLGTLVQSALDALGLASPLVVLLVGVHQVMEGRLTLGEMLTLSALATGFLAPLSTLVPTAFLLQLLGSYLVRINDVLETPPEQARDELPHPERLSGRVALEGVSFAYGPKAPPAIQEVSLEVEPGQMIALVGPSGAGKTTLANLLVGLYRPTAGRVLYDGCDLAHLDLHRVRRQMGIVSQQPYLFGTTIRENIALNDPALPLDRVIEAARLAQIHEDIEAMPLGYDTRLSDGGLSLSGGQRQRLALARALVHRPSILLLDEATSALDGATEAAIERELKKLGCTRIVIAHRLSTIALADRILVLLGGRVVDQGSHAELSGREGWYARMIEMQKARQAV